jgi:hypothetical protein
MKKIKLELDALQVESFEAGTADRAVKGTVHANVFNRDIPHYESEGLACATNGFNYCAAPSYGCVEVSGQYVMTHDCPTYYC